jgi:hypothetical protein
MGFGGKWLNKVDFLLKPVVSGCAVPCTENLTITLNLTAAPAGSNVTISLNESTSYDPAKTINLVPTATNPQPQVDISPYSYNYTLFNCTTVINWSSAIHFDKVGSYTLCFEAWCPTVEECPTCSDDPVLIADECFDIEVYQWKDAAKIPLYRKWNLISLPLVPLVEDMPIEDVLASHPKASLIEAIYNYDCDTGGWDVWGNGQTSLATLKDGDAYWVKVNYVLGSVTKAPGLAIGGLWVWGTPKPVPPSSPSAYPVCPGWNMVGLTGYDDGTYPWLGTTTDLLYLWNWLPFSGYGAILLWDGQNQIWDNIALGGGTMAKLQVGEGYWISFLDGIMFQGFVYPP